MHISTISVYDLFTNVNRTDRRKCSHTKKKIKKKKLDDIPRELFQLQIT